MMTSPHEQSELVRSHRRGVDSDIVKPVQFEGFVYAVQEIGRCCTLLNQPPAAAPARRS